MKKFDITPLLPFYDKAADVCRDAFRRDEVAPQALLEELMDIPGLPMHCPPHHFILPAALLVVVGRAQGIPEAQFEEDLLEIEERAKEVPGGACGFYGSCGAAVGIGLFFSVYTGTDPHSEEHWGECNLATGRALQAIGEISGPRCCKRNSYLALVSGLNTVQELLGVALPHPGKIACKYHDSNPDCKGTDCPFFHQMTEFEIKVPEKAFPQNKEGKDCECMNREYLLTYKKGRLHWLCAPGDTVAKGQLLCEAEIEKRIFEVLSPADGVLSRQCVEEGARFTGEDVLGVVTADG